MQSVNKVLCEQSTYAKNGLVAIYLRLSSDDGREGESNSIINQKAMLEKYVADNNLGRTQTYVDDGYTGTNFNRPGFEQLLNDIDMGYIHTVVVKDLSRLGRDYVNVGYYTDTFFPDRNIRFIAVNDLVDSADGENEIAPFKNVMNEMYARDISRKVRSAHKIRGSLGEPLAPPPYGYMKDPENPKKWIVDLEAASVVKKIFQYCIEGKGVETTARLLQEEQIFVPMAYWHSKGVGRGGRKNQENPYKWNKSTIREMLQLSEYAGDLINFKTYSKSYKNKKRYDNPKENWKVFKDNHEAIIDRETFEMVQKIRVNTKRRKPKTVDKNMFCDLVYCADCGSKLWFNVNHPNTDIHYFNCSNYKGNRGTCNATHYIRADSLEEVVKLELSKMMQYLKDDEETFTQLLVKKTAKDAENERKIIDTKLSAAKIRNKLVSDLYEKTYEDNAIGKITDERFMQLSHKYDVEQSELKITIRTLENELLQLEQTELSKDSFISAIRRFMQMDKLTPHVLRELIKKIEVYHIEGVGKNRTQRIVIHYRFIGVLEMPKKLSDDVVTLEARQGVAVSYHVKAG
ncbi:MAG: recombinase family protein [Eubacteriales bacterium]|nr:recombinase family protein [Eubacteriales bacterium]